MESDPLAAESATQDAARLISEAFHNNCLDPKTDVWQKIELTDCQAIADQVMPYAVVQRLKKWNMDHLSFRTDPVQPLLSE